MSNSLDTPEIAPEKTGEQADEELDLSPFFYYLATEQGHQIANRILDIIDDVKKSTITHNANYSKLEKWQQVIIIGLVVITTSVLTYYDKFDSTVGVLFGTLVGYAFGKRK